MAKADLPRYTELMLPVLRAINGLGGSGSGREIIDAVIASLGFADIDVAETYPNRPKSVLIDRIEWARSYCKLGGALESPQRSLYLITSLGREITALSDKEASARLAEIDRQVRAARRQGKPRRPQLRRGHLLRMRRQRKASSTSRS